MSVTYQKEGGVLTGYGYHVKIKDAEGNWWLYAHLKGKDVDPSGVGLKVGDTITVGTKIGLCDSSGDSTGAHLHLEYRLGSEWGTKTCPSAKLPLTSCCRRDSWYAKLHLLNLIVDNDDLIFYGDPDGVISLPRYSNGRKGWDEGRLEKRKLLDSQAKEMAVGDRLVKPERAGKYIIINSGDSIRIEKSDYLRITDK